MVKKVLTLVIVMISALSVNTISAQEKNQVLVENITSIAPLGNTRHFVAYCASGKIPVTDILYINRVRGHEQDFRVVSIVVNDTVRQRTLCSVDKVEVTQLAIKSVASVQKDVRNLAVVNFTNGETWETEDLNWLEALPGQKVNRSTYDGETYRFARYLTDGEVDQSLYHQFMAQK